VAATVAVSCAAGCDRVIVDTVIDAEIYGSAPQGIPLAGPSRMRANTAQHQHNPAYVTPSARRTTLQALQDLSRDAGLGNTS
jgi:hypothetical protein